MGSIAMPLRGVAESALVEEEEEPKRWGCSDLLVSTLA